MALQVWPVSSEHRYIAYLKEGTDMKEHEKTVHKCTDTARVLYTSGMPEYE